MLKGSIETQKILRKKKVLVTNNFGNHAKQVRYCRSQGPEIVTSSLPDQVATTRSQLLIEAETSSARGGGGTLPDFFFFFFFPVQQTTSGIGHRVK